MGNRDYMSNKTWEEEINGILFDNIDIVSKDARPMSKELGTNLINFISDNFIEKKRVEEEIEKSYIYPEPEAQGTDVDGFMIGHNHAEDYLKDTLLK